MKMQLNSEKYRTHRVGELSQQTVGQHVRLSGYIHALRRYKNHTFIELREESGQVQLFVPNRVLPLVSEEGCICIEGVCALRKTPHPRLHEYPTGEIEITVEHCTVLNQAGTLPFASHENPLENETLANAPLAMRWGNNLRARAKIVQAMRRVLEENEFIEVETPILVRNTPGGATPFVVPFNEQHYALAQSPQIWKQLLMCGGMERYYQLAHCFRNEGARPERQPEFSQFEIEMAFVSQEEGMAVMEAVTNAAMETVGCKKIRFPRYTYAQALALFGSEKPHLGNPLRVISTPAAATARFEHGNASVVLPRALTREEEKIYLHGLWEAVGLKGNVTVSGNTIALEGPLETIQLALGKMIKYIAEEWELINPGVFPTWITHFPMFEEENGEYVSAHHPFTRPLEGHTFEQHPTSVLAAAFDLAINGFEVGGGSMRIHESLLQQQAFEKLGWSKQEYMIHFKPLLEALERGAPPHGGMALGVERLCCVLLGLPHIRAVMAFPKTASGQCLLTQALRE